MQSKKKYSAKIKGYDVTVRDYGYTSRWPVLVTVCGTRLGEDTNHLGEPCYFYKTVNAYTLREGIEAAKQIVKTQQATK